MCYVPLAAASRPPLWIEPSPDGGYVAGSHRFGDRELRFSSGLTMRVTDGRQSKATPSGRLPGVSHDLRGGPSQWRTAIPHFDGVRYPGVYPGIDLVYHVAGSFLEFDFEVAPGLSTNRIVLEFDRDCRIEKANWSRATTGCMPRAPTRTASPCRAPTKCSTAAGSDSGWDGTTIAGRW